MLAAIAGAAATDERCTDSGEDVLRPGTIMDGGAMTGATRPSRFVVAHPMNSRRSTPGYSQGNQQIFRQSHRR
jgi:hypothetical protein